MPGPLVLGLIGAGLGAAKSSFIDAPRARRQRLLEAETARYSPWTGLKSDPSRVQESNMLGNMVALGVDSAQFGQNLEDQAADRKLKEAQTGYYSRGGLGSVGNTWAGMKRGPASGLNYNQPASRMFGVSSAKDLSRSYIGSTPQQLGMPDEEEANIRNYLSR